MVYLAPEVWDPLVRLVVAVLDAHGCGAGRHVEGDEHVAALERGVELAGDDLVDVDRIARAGGGNAFGLSRGRNGEEQRVNSIKNATVARQQCS